MKFHSKVKKLWDLIIHFTKILMTARISLIMVILSAIIFFGVSQVKDAIIALGNFAAMYQFVITSIAGFVWALLIWYWARVFYYLEYWDKGLQPWEKAIIVHTPRILGGTALVIFGIAFLTNGISLYHEVQTDGINLIIFGCVFLLYTIVFLSFVYFRRTIFHLQTDVVHIKHNTEDEFLPFSKLPFITRVILISSTVFYLIILFLLIISPIRFTIFLGDGVTILFLCLGIWLPVCYWILLGSKRTGLPLYLFLFIIIAIFSLFNSNKNVRIMNNPEEPIKRTETMYEYFEHWYTTRQSEKQKDNRLPLVLVLSEGGGIRASYWGAGLLSALHEKHKLFSEFVFGIYGISGGAFSGTVFDTLIKFDKDYQDFYDEIPESTKKKLNLSKDSIIRYLSNDIIGKDYLSPVIAAMFTSEVVQMILPFPVTQFDYAKVFEKTWEYHWNHAFYKLGISLSKNTISFASPFNSLWAGDSHYKIPRLFIGITRVEDGSPYLISHIKLDDTNAAIPHSGVTKDFFWFTKDVDIRVSTASLLSARFPYVGPAGTCRRDDNFAGFVDGGYFDNTGANTAYSNLVSIKASKEKNTGSVEFGDSIYRKLIRPIVIYIKNGSVLNTKTFTGPGMLYQASAPIDCVFNTREAHTDNAIDRLKEYIKLYDGIFATISLKSLDDIQNETFDIPLGWALSKSVQIEIDKRIDYVIKESSPDNPPLEINNDPDKEEIENLRKILSFISAYDRDLN